MSYAKLQIRDRVSVVEQERLDALAHKRALERADKGLERPTFRAADGTIKLWKNRVPYKEWKRQELEEMKKAFAAKKK